MKQHKSMLTKLDSAREIQDQHWDSDRFAQGKLPDFDLSKPELYELPGGKFVEIFDCVSDHLAVLKSIGITKMRLMNDAEI